MVRKQKEDFTNYMTSVLQNSMLTGIPQIASAGNIPKKVLRALVFILCLVGFIYQSLIFLYMYWEYETVIDVQVTNPPSIDVPSMTICTLNGIQLSKMCADDKYKSKCSQLHDTKYTKWCECAPRYCEDGELLNISVPSYKDLRSLYSMPQEEYKKYLQTMDDFIDYCRYFLTSDDILDTDCILDNFESTRCSSLIETTVPSCFTINTRLGRPDAEQLQVLSNGHMLIELNVDGKEYATWLGKISTQISFHHSRTKTNPYVYGYTMYPQNKYIFRMKRVIHKRLPHPYVTNCIDYFERWRLRGGRGPTTQRECIEECQKNASLALNGCLEDAYKVPGNEPRCTETLRNPETLKVYQMCAEKNCQPACYEEIYEVSRDEVDLNYVLDCSGGGRDPDRVQILIYFDGMKTTVYEYSPKFQNIETFSYLGGYVGMWLGISLVAVFDFLETLVIMMKYPFKKYALFKAKRSQVENMRRARRNF